MCIHVIVDRCTILHEPAYHKVIRKLFIYKSLFGALSHSRVARPLVYLCNTLTDGNGHDPRPRITLGGESHLVTSAPPERLASVVTMGYEV